MENITITTDEYKILLKAQAAAEFVGSFVDKDKCIYLDQKTTRAVLILIGRYNNNDIV